MRFAPLNCVNVLVGCINVKLYPPLTKDMPVHERDHAFQVNKTTLTNLPADFSLILDASGMQLNASSMVEGIMSDWRLYFKDHWMDFGHLAILSFHHSDGDRIDDSTIPTDPQQLLPVVDGAITTCRKVKFLRVQFTLDFATAPSFITLDLYPVAPVFRASYYIKLPQGSRALLNGTGAGYNLVSFLGVDDLQTLTWAEVITNILSMVQQDSPVLLQALDFNLQAVNTDSNEINVVIDCKILKLAWHQICSSVFAKICTGYTNQPQAALNHIKQNLLMGMVTMLAFPCNRITST